MRYVSANGGIRWNNGWMNVSIVWAGEYVGFEEFEALFSVSFFIRTHPDADGVEDGQTHSHERHGAPDYSKDSNRTVSAFAGDG